MGPSVQIHQTTTTYPTHAFHPSTQKTEGWVSVSSRPALFTQQVPGHFHPSSPLSSVPHSHLLCEGHTSPATFAFLFLLHLSSPAVVGLDGHACESLFRKDPSKWEVGLQSGCGFPIQSLGITQAKENQCTCPSGTSALSAFLPSQL